MGSTHRPYLSLTLADLIDCRRFRKLCNSIGNYRLVQAFPRLTHIDKRLYTKRQLLFSFNSPSWSLCCEQLFYICFPFLIAFTKDYRKLLSIFLICTILSIVGMYFTPMESIKGYWYVNPITRLPDFIAGMLLFQLYDYLKTKNITSSQGSIIEIASIALFLSFYLYAAEIPKVYRYSCYYWLPIAFILISFSLQKGIVSRLLSNRLLVIGGEISYSFYLIHLLYCSLMLNGKKKATFI